MITKMKKYTFLVFHKEYDAFLTMLREAGVVHISQKAEGVSEDPAMQQLLEKHKDLLRLQAQGAPDQLLAERQEVAHRIADTERQLSELAVWGDFSREKLEALTQNGYTLRFFYVRKDLFRAEWGTPIAEKSGSVYFVAIASMAPMEEIGRFATEVTVEKSATDVSKDIDALKGLLAAADARIDAWRVANKEALQKDIQEAEAAIEWQKVVLNTDKAAEGALCLLEGYCPEDRCPALNHELDAQHIYYEAVDPILGDNAPIELHNNRFARLFESFTGMYGWPTYGEFDPTPILAPFYLLFFAMCLGDAGYGLILILFGLLTHYKKVNIEMFSGQGPIIAVLGAGTTIVGLIMGTFFGISLYDAAWYPEALKAFILHGNVMGFDIAMVASLLIGVVHICLAMVVKAICYTKRFGLKENLGTWGWTLLIVGGIILAALAMAFHLPAELTRWLVIGLAAVSALGIYLFNTPGRNPLINIGAGLYDTYNMASGLVSDVLSYVRLYALGLSGGILGSTFNTLGMMVIGDSSNTAPAVLALEMIFACVILLFGHVLNILLSSLGAFVHPLRLNFVEYFKNAGYEGKGEKYTPFKQ